MGNIKDAYNNLEGAKIVNIREMTKKESDVEGWDLSHNGCRVLVLSNGIKLYASQDYEGNGPGALFFYNKKGETYEV
jgi:hypothetical protein|tara:strand:+ start:690 stop:920 length:231 start_codon:yes stop_codon:yes gene_type:complete